ncbi:MAG TPA: hypothetical protein VIT44_13595 [Cyclobacteriaceae bacterium]
MKKLVNLSLYIILMITAKTGFAQQEVSQSSVSNVLKLNFLLPGISYEQKIAKYQTLDFNTYMDAIVLWPKESFNNQTQIFFTPSVSTELRNYYNINKREKKGLRTSMNSANYIAPLYIGRYSKTIYYPDLKWVNQVGAVWGMQRNSPKGFSLDLNLGLIYTFDAQYYSFLYSSIEPLIQVELGFWLGRKSH